MNKTEERLEKWCNPEGIKFKDSKAEENYKKRARRFANAILLKPVDTIPQNISWGMFPALHNGYTIEEVSKDFSKMKKALVKTLDEFQPDVSMPVMGISALYDFLGYKYIKLPGRDIPPTSNYQYIEAEYVKAEEFYDHFLDDPTDFILRVLSPRIYSTMNGLEKLPPFGESLDGLLRTAAGFGDPEVAASFETLLKAGKIARKEGQENREFVAEMVTMGFPDTGAGNCSAPFDFIGDHVRGTKGILLDMYRRPEKLMAAIDKITPYMIQKGIRGKKSNNPVVRMALHKHAEGFMSKEQFKTFYWPSLKKVFMGLIAEGLVPQPFWEGENTSRLDVICDVPKGTCIYQFQDVDINKYKEICSNTVCFMGNLPISLLCTGTPQQVKDYVKKLIDMFGKNGGYILNSSCNLENAKYENVKAMVEFAREYGANK
jgi:uroporphyrinogen-III decarboxylase